MPGYQPKMKVEMPVPKLELGVKRSAVSLPEPPAVKRQKFEPEKLPLVDDEEEDEDGGIFGADAVKEEEVLQSTKKQPANEEEDEDEDGLFGAETKPLKSELKEELVPQVKQ